MHCDLFKYAINYMGQMYFPDEGHSLKNKIKTFLKSIDDWYMRQSLISIYLVIFIVFILDLLIFLLLYLN